MDFISSTLAYAPERRVKPLEGCAHRFFDTLRDPKTKLPTGNGLPPIFDFTQQELNMNPEIIAKLIPDHAKNESKERDDDDDNGGGKTKST
jgi:glycogen synthase kinase 3 beta